MGEGNVHTGVIKEISKEGNALVDFNHELAGHDILWHVTLRGFNDTTAPAPDRKAQEGDVIVGDVVIAPKISESGYLPQQYLIGSEHGFLGMDKAIRRLKLGQAACEIIEPEDCPDGA